ncbi:MULTISPECIES: phosphate/phosphite/phosphonate ABC transporter substrate-binding protein [Roseobacteraceae]|uniref:phosphate/phosphite/phosphonate ABC transporter substrate-binding protein n=1 Tax=Roseobacteraceae TaxID=2854170 RepID=UPI001C48C615|nr:MULTISPECIES: PhnD/SsuA/transferrin family substrate-binding protein [Roseobacteraceae]MBV7408848.1 PhnD/SsuA/transferrin family substrate-binding protein [Maritimibacter sp. DP1N21-5]MBY5934465.1 PhnD/SsuA/transferrin family substrate-binding protein [Tateyamaria omphalii]
MIASLGMYDMPHLQRAHDRLWAGIRTALGYGPDHLTRGGDPWAEWQSPDLLLAQTCGLPYRARLHDKVTLVGTPDYDLPDCPSGYYFSYLIRRRDDPRPLRELSKQGVMAYNEPLSQSGWAAPVAHLAARGLRPKRIKQTGSHLGSINSVLLKTADYAAIDAVTMLLWGAHDMDAVAYLEAFDTTEPTPALPYITALDRDPAPIADAVRSAIAAMPHEDRCDLRLKGMVDIPASEYLALPIPPTP